ncbi:MAG: alpha/beta hydrolase family protein [Desulfomonilaceae bacterium]
MEINLIRAMFSKLLEALRIKPTPARSVEIDPSDQRRKESFRVVSDGITIRGKIYFPSARPAMLYPALVICHGIPGSGAARPQNDPGYEGLAADFSSSGIAAVIFNFRGCGDSGGDFDMMGWVRDLEAVLDKTLNTPHIDPTRVMLLGFSGGGAAAIRVAADSARVYSVAAVGTPAHFGIFEKDPTDIVADFKERGLIRDPGFPPDLDRWIDGFKEIEPKRWIPQVRAKHILIVHGDADELIPVEQSREIFDHAPAGVAELHVIPGGVHRLRLDSRSIEMLKEWFLKTLGWKA